MPLEWHSERSGSPFPLTVVVVEHPTTIYRLVKGLPDIQIIGSSIPEALESSPRNSGGEVESAVLYTTFGFALYRIEDSAFQEACFGAYNDWLAEFCRYAPTRFAGLAVIPLYDPEVGRKELERCKKLGLKGGLIWAAPPEDRPYHLPIYDSFWAAAEEACLARAAAASASASA